MTIDNQSELGYWGRRVLVLGASGFIGRWVARRLSAEGARVYLVVRNLEAARAVSRRFGIEGEIIVQDLEQREEVYDLFHRVKPSITFNLVDFGPEQSEQDKARAHQVNADLVLALCEGIAGNRDPSWGGQDMVQLGTAHEYGAAHPDWDEESDSLPTTVYGESKLSGTRFLKHCSRAFGLKGITARVFSVYGPGEHGRGLLPALLAIAEGESKLALHVSEDHRDWTYVGDVAEGLCRLGLVRTSESGIVNLASGRWTSAQEFVQQASRLLRLPGERVQLDVKGESNAVRYAPVPLARLKSLTGWMPAIGIEEGILKTMEYENILGRKGIEWDSRAAPELGSP